MRPDWWEYIADEPSEVIPTKVRRTSWDKNVEPVGVSFLKLGYVLSQKVFTPKEIAAAKKQYSELINKEI